jgi:hypothetical protein
MCQSQRRHGARATKEDRMPELSDLAPEAMQWRKSSKSGTNGCLEVAHLGTWVVIRDSKDKCGPVLAFTSMEWSAFLAGVRAGEFGTT